MLHAIREGFGLVRRNTEVHAVSVKGLTKLVSRSESLETVWHDALDKLRGEGLYQISKRRIDPFQLPQDPSEGWASSTRGESEGFGIKA